ncbi:MAG: hypothetical protein HY051_03575 [Candidatus Aenigmarchaeota archaeon]|nr:hypothetical protein [Candidatus Aenigmarchaeota archaeon]
MKFMPTQTQILVPALMDGGRVVVPQVWLGRNVDYRTANGHPFTAADYQKFNPPTLAELRRAYFDKNPDGSWISPEYRHSLPSQGVYGEWTSTFLRDGNEIVERPEKIYFDEVGGLWIAEGGKTSPIKLPNDGWTLEYDERTGFPSRTGSRKDAKKLFGDDASYFCSTKNDLRAVLRVFSLGDEGLFYVYAGYDPDDWDSAVGVRSARPATPTYYDHDDVMSQEERNILIRRNMTN